MSEVADARKLPVYFGETVVCQVPLTELKEGSGANTVTRLKGLIARETGVPEDAQIISVDGLHFINPDDNLVELYPDLLSRDASIRLLVRKGCVCLAFMLIRK